jgi:hypothetical protein
VPLPVENAGLGDAQKKDGSPSSTSCSAMSTHSWPVRLLQHSGGLPVVGWQRFSIFSRALASARRCSPRRWGWPGFEESGASQLPTAALPSCSERRHLRRQSVFARAKNASALAVVCWHFAPRVETVAARGVVTAERGCRTEEERLGPGAIVSVFAVASAVQPPA